MFPTPAMKPLANPIFHSTPASKAGCFGLEGVADELRVASGWFAWPLGVASLARLALERNYWGPAYLAWLVAIVVYAAAQGRILQSPNSGKIRLALIVNFLAIGAGYPLIGAAMAAAPGWRADDALYRIELRVFGRDPQEFLVPWHTPWVSTVSILGYVAFVGLLLYLFLVEAFRLSRATGRLQLGLMALYGIGYSGYILFPAAGPLFHHGALLAPVAQSELSAYLDAWVIRCCSHVDAWPSLHAAVCCFALIWTYRRQRPVFYILILPCAALLLGAVYFQLHYFIDLAGGGALGVACGLAVCAGAN